MQESDEETDPRPRIQVLQNIFQQVMNENQPVSGSQQNSGSVQRREQPENPERIFQSELEDMYEDSNIIYDTDFEEKLSMDTKDQLTSLQEDYLEQPNLTSLSDSLARLHLSRCVLHWAQNLKPKNLEKMYKIFYEFIEEIIQGKHNLKKWIKNFQPKVAVKFPSSLQEFRNGQKCRMIKAYTNQTFFYGLIALATRKANLRVECMSTVAFAIYQMHEELLQLSNQQLKQHKESNRQYKKTVYRGMKGIDKKEIEKLKAIQEEGEIFQFEGFFSTSQSQKVGTQFAAGNYLVVIEIDIDLDLKALSGSKRIKGCFADISSISSQPNQQQVLFSCFNYFEFKGYEEKSDPKLTVIRLKYIDVESVFRKPVCELSIAEKKVLKSYKKTERIIRSEVVNQGGLFFINFDFENFYNYHVGIAKEMVQRATPVGEQYDWFINRHHNKLSKLAEQLTENRPPGRELLRKLVGYCLVQLSCNKTYTNSLLHAYFFKEQDPEILWMKFELLSEFKQDSQSHYWILIALMTGLSLERIGFYNTHRDEVNKYLSKTNKMNLDNAFFAHSLQLMVKQKQRQECGIVCSSYRYTTLHHHFLIIWFLNYEYTMNVWAKNTLPHFEKIINLYFYFLQLLIDNCHFDKAQDVLETLKKIIEGKSAKEYLEKKQPDLLRKMQNHKNTLEAYFNLKQFIRSQQKDPTLVDKARQIYLQLMKEQEVGSRLHALLYNMACICLHAGTPEDADGYIQKILNNSPTQEMQLQVQVLIGRLWLKNQNSVGRQGVRQISKSLIEMLNNQTKLSGDCIADISDYLDELQKHFAGEDCVKQFARLAYRTVRWTPTEPPAGVDGRLLQFEHFKTICQAAFEKVKGELQSRGQLPPFMVFMNVDTVEQLMPQLVQTVKAFLEDPNTYSGIMDLSETIKQYFKDYPGISKILQVFL